MQLASRFLLPLASAAVFAGTFLLGWRGSDSPTGSSPDVLAQQAGSVQTSPDPGLTIAGQTFDQAIVAADQSEYRRALRLAEAASALSIEETVAALERQHARFGRRYDDQTDVTEALLARYAELDPTAATLWLLHTYPTDQRSQWMRVTLGTWLTRDRTSALKWARGLPIGDLRDSVTNELFRRLLILDPAAAEQQADVLDAGGGLRGPLYHALAEKDLPTTLAHVMKLPARSAKEYVGTVLDVWARRDTPRALAWVSQLPPGGVRNEALDSVYRNWIAQDPSAAASAMAVQGGGALARFGSEVASGWAKQDVDAARHWAEQLPSRVRRDALAAISRVWIERDPQAAAAYAIERVGPDDFGMAEEAGFNWQSTDLPGALGWMETLPPGELQDHVRSRICSAWVYRDPRACLEYLNGQSGDSIRAVFDQCAGGWAENGAEDVWQWSRGLADPARRDQAGIAALLKAAEADPTGTATLYSQVSGEGKTYLAEKIASSWVKSDVPALRQWAVALPAGEARDAAWQALLSGWGKEDSREAATWIEACPAGPSRDAGIKGLIGEGEALAPGDGVRLAKLVMDAEARGQALDAVLRNWLSTDRGVATVWIQQSPDLSPETRAQLLAVPAKSNGSDQ